MDIGIGLVLNLARDMFFDDSDTESDNSNIPKVYEYAEDVVPRFSDQTFKCHFRINPQTFEDLFCKMHSVENEAIHCGHKPIPLEKQLMITIWCLSNLESFRSVADRFAISKSTCWDVLYRTCRNLLKVNSRYKIISWPNRERALTIMTEFQAINDFPGIIGAIDGSHIRIIKPKDHPNSYCNRKNYHSVLLQGVCDHRKLFLDVYAGEPGSLHDMRLFRKSDLYERIQNLSVDFPEDSHIIGDLAYKLSVNVLVGFKNLGNLTNRQMNYNKKLSECRVVIENAFAYLKGRFRRLKYLETVRLDLIALLIVSGCIMHNICILNGDLPQGVVDENEIREVMNENAEVAEIDHEPHYNEVNEAIIKRLGILNGLYMDNYDE